MRKPENKPTVSIIIPTYNRAHFLGEAIQSVLDQTYQDFEIIVIDDASTDNTEELVKSFGDERIRYIRLKENSGASSVPRNTGLRAARGEYIAFLDSDDRWFPTKLTKQMGLIAAHNLDFIASQVIDVNLSSGTETVRGNVIKGKTLLSQILSGECNIPMSTIVVKRSTIDNSNISRNISFSLINKRIALGAQHFEILIALSKSKFFFLEEPLARYTLHGNNISISHNFYLIYAIYLIISLGHFNYREYCLVFFFSIKYFFLYFFFPVKRFLSLLKNKFRNMIKIGHPYIGL